MAVLKEIHRVLKKGGTFFIREHDTPDKHFDKFLDVVHKTYMMVLPPPNEEKWDKKSYYTKYHSKSEWIKIITEVGFREVYSEEKNNNVRTFYTLFIKL
jgi:ubiquinone/menaquinone biosynthesis C-methylase UbiE